MSTITNTTTAEQRRRAPQKRSPQRNRILAACRERGEPMSPKEIAEASGVDYGVVRHLVLKMAITGDLSRTGCRYFTPAQQR